MRQSMTGYASVQGTGLGLAWTWELRGVNGKGLELRLRLPDWVDGLEPLVRKAAGDRLARGNVQMSLRIASDDTAGASRLDEVQLQSVLGALRRIEAEAMTQGLSLAPSTAADIVALRGVLTQDAVDVDQDALRGALMTDFDTALMQFVQMRGAEGAALQDVLARILDEIAALIQAAQDALSAREADRADRLRQQLRRVLDSVEMEEGRIAQELALIAVKADVTEELDRLRAHLAATRDLLARPGPVGRKLDFLSQEFNREANTLCAKSGDAALTQVGLDLKGAIDRLREQIQNVE